MAIISLIGLLNDFGYGSELIDRDVAAPGQSTKDRLEAVAFTRAAPHDLRTSAIAIGSSETSHVGDFLELCRAIAAPFALFGEVSEDVLYRVGATASTDEAVHRFGRDAGRAQVVTKFSRLLDPAALQRAKSGTRQLTLFPVDVRLLERARLRSVGSLRERLEAAFALTLESDIEPHDAAQIVINGLTCVVVSHKYRTGASTPVQMVASALQRHGSYFDVLAQWESDRPDIVERVLNELSSSLDYGALDARSLNAGFEQLFMNSKLRKELGVFYTPPEFANRILDSLPIEELPPDDRCVFDPACGSGNLLLATQERLEALAPGSWDTRRTHDWLKTHLIGSDVDSVAVLLAKHSLLVSALPLGNTWRVEQVDFMRDQPRIDPRPTLIVSNPPWALAQGTRDEQATKFLHKATGILADGGFLACILPVSWLSTAANKHSRGSVNETLDIFEVWRLPRDMFSHARVGCAVVFGQKRPSQARNLVAYTWVGAGAPNRKAFLDHGTPTYRKLIPAPAGSTSFTWGPLDDFLARHPAESTLQAIASIESGIVQRGTPTAQAKREDRVPFIARGTQLPILGVVPESAITWLDADAEEVLGSAEKAERLRSMTPKVLLQADRFPDNPWRARPVLDLIGIVPVGLWHVAVLRDRTTADALMAYFASASVACWFHTHAGKRITVAQLKDLPLPSGWEAARRELAQLGRRLTKNAPSPELMTSIDAAVHGAFGYGRRVARYLEEMVAGFEAPEGAVRYRVKRPQPATTSDATPARAGAVLEQKGTRLRVWVVDGDDDGKWTDLPVHMPGWLATADATFDLEGPIETGRYLFHRSAHLARDWTGSG
jgi:methylase of polypeptide subunit release factors